ncbi:MAG TPA: hypothetical protein VMJ32_16835 [Pirellulales bacterium]|nr:hypothetical protein [Pirellulales bacterium]
MRIRKRLFVDRKVQGALMLRAVEYWFCCVLTIALALLAWSLLTGPDQPLYQFFLDAWRFFLPTAVVSLLILPLLVYDIMKLSNRFTGPVYRLRRELRRLAAGENVSLLRFRDEDYWFELADEFNAVAQRMEMFAERTETGRTPADHSNRAGAHDNLYVSQLGADQRADVSLLPDESSDSLQDEFPLRDRLRELPRSDPKHAQF